MPSASLSLPPLYSRELLRGVGVARRLEAAVDEGVGDALFGFEVDVHALVVTVLVRLVGDEVHRLGRVRRALVLEDYLQHRVGVALRELLGRDELRRDEE